ncbi:carbohydrate ABC transporter permease [Microbacterium sp. cx-55]|uniref:carbohydrate ABC transporter permease n=1 Tax=unclassified Microbacterium TaxID=2609290 RepID=UPI001CBBD6FF|nr:MULTISPECIES: carbohydrate ABC transporter permease [unclassified Microbacterium]MCC4908125.1 carbohydrate ABC transporter permease [Microbacterium sp. cx-59]UGB35734.1 carbohydrate ABC transporter permease [Microbacterium sp. cx-55]
MSISTKSRTRSDAALIAGPRPRPGTRAKKRTRLARAGVIIGLLLGAVFAAAPVLWMLSSSFKSNREIFELPPRLITESFSFDAYAAILTNPETVRFFINSYVVAGAVTILTLLVAIQAAYAFSRFEFRGKRVLNVVIVSVQAVPPITLLIPYFGLMVGFGLYNTYAGLILTYMVFTLPYAIIMMTGYLNTLPRELDEAVRMDGAGSFTALWRVLVPIAVPGIVSVGIYTFMIAWNEYLFALTLTRTTDMRTVPIGIQLLMGQHSYEWNQIMAMSILGSIPVLILFLVLQRYFISGLTAGSVKS